eukprot:TRINITY_DN42648_c0_g1_i1.p1 TRINITY_DN42648_c0_g1~~TRINITY_DN42648_c0_g1_i1.p1  ORF type:complete len:528 (+),score=60.58 TRINITY_DN42648_c0_g1_i1:92-1675(+)
MSASSLVASSGLSLAQKSLGNAVPPALEPPWYSFPGAVEPDPLPSVHCLAPYNHNLLMVFFLDRLQSAVVERSPTGVSFGCFYDYESFAECCGSQPVLHQRKAESISEQTVDHWCFRFPYSRHFCCSEHGVLDRIRQIQPVKMEMWEPDIPQHDVRLSRVWQRLPGARCVQEASRRLLDLMKRFDSCSHPDKFCGGARTGTCHRRCAERVLAAASLHNLSASSAYLGDRNQEPPRRATCWPTPAVWSDVVGVLSRSLQHPTKDLRRQLRESIMTLNVYFFEINHMIFEPSFEGTLSRPSKFKFPHAPLAYPQSLHHRIEGVAGPHRGTVLLRLMQELAVHGEGEARSGRSGLVYVELGIAYGQLARWLIRRSIGLLRQVHLVDTFDVENFDEEVKPTLQSTAREIEDLGFVTCEEEKEEETRRAWLWPTIRLCSRTSDLNIVVHKGSTAEVASAFQAEEVDLVFVDASHLYPHVSADVQMWWPLVKQGGIMAGHDFRYAVGGVKQVVGEFFEGDVYLDSDSVWWTSK